MSTAIPLLTVIALSVAIALAGVAIWAALEAGKAARSARRLAEDLDSRVVPLADKLDVTVDAFNAELLRVDLIVDQLEGAVDRLSGTAETVREVVDAPIHLVSEVAERFRHGFRRRGSRPRHEDRAERTPDDASPVVVLETDGEADSDFARASDDEAAETGGVIVGDIDFGGADTPSVIEAVSDLGEPVAESAAGTDEPEVAESEPETLGDLEPTNVSASQNDDPEEA